VKPVRLLPEATVEVDSALGWYRRELSHRAAAFASAVDEAFDRVGRMPEIFPLVDLPANPSAVRRAPVHGFPWGVFFVDAGSEVIVIAIAHARREPGYWAKRLES